MRPSSLPLPARMAALPKDHRGLPVPYVVLVDAVGKAHFSVNDTAKVLGCLREDRCAVCGQPLTRGRWWVGGPLSALHEDGWYLDTPLHRECAEYSLSVCPYLAAPAYARGLAAATVDPSALPATALFRDDTMIPERPPVFVAVMGTRTVLRETPHGTYNRPNRPHRRLEFWRGGHRISDADAAPLVAEALAGVDVDAIRARPAFRVVRPGVRPASAPARAPVPPP